MSLRTQRVSPRRLQEKGQEKTRQRRVIGWGQEARQVCPKALVKLSHEDGDEGQQENKNRTSDRYHHWDVFHDTFNRIFVGV